LSAASDRVWFITGASSGIGKSLALAVLARGERVAVTARDRDRLPPAIKENKQALTLSLEIADPEQCRRAIEQTETAFGGVNVLVNNAGHGMIGAIEEVSDAEARLVFDSNVFGLLNIIRAALSGMRQRRSGHVVNVGSVGGIVARAGSGIYAATKFAVEGISEGLYHELKPLGITVTIVEPGPFRTDFSGRSMHQAASMLADYDATAGAWRRNVLGSHGTQRGDPDKAARVIIQAVDAPKPPLHLVLGASAMSRATEKCLDLLKDIETWREASAATDFD